MRVIIHIGDNVVPPNAYSDIAELEIFVVETDSNVEGGCPGVSDPLTIEPLDQFQMPPAFINHYTCPRCQQDWMDKWSAQCDDDCPGCGFRHVSPTVSDDATEKLPALDIADEAFGMTNMMNALRGCTEEHGLLRATLTMMRNTLVNRRHVHPAEFNVAIAEANRVLEETADVPDDPPRETRQ